ncbi:unnamed protein product [Penicillium olsonii]|nr:unnamed protein product [Penicillium olsonii]
MSNPDAYQELAQVFKSRGNQVLEIEIIPSSLGSFLQDGNAVGTSKKTLVAAYTVARQLFSNLQPGDFSQHVITEIMLLFDCEHLTACNWRKRRLNAAMAAPGFSQDLLQAELTLMTSYQCSPLHRHTKSPTLWHHRLWVLGHLLQMRSHSPQDLLDLLKSELEGVLRAGELHPRNYYAFSYMRQLSVLLIDSGAHWDSLTIDRIVDWCLANPRDISGWSFAVYVLGSSTQQSQVQALEKVARFALGVGWEGESLWTFIAQSAQRFGLEASLERMLIPEKTDTIHEAIPDGSRWSTWLELARAYWAHNGR